MSDFDHFLRAQEKAYAAAREELAAGYKKTHWMWFIFPQVRGLGRSETAVRFGLDGIPEAVAYADHPILGERLRECVKLANSIENRTARQVFGSPDDLKFRSCLTLFLVATEREEFRIGLERYYAGQQDPLTLKLLCL